MKQFEGFRVQMYPSPEQEKQLLGYCEASRYSYNWALGKFNEIYEETGKWVSSNELCKIFTHHRTNDEGDTWDWLRSFNAAPLRIIVRSVKKQFLITSKSRSKHRSTKINFPKFMKKKEKRYHFFVRKECLRIFDDYISFEGFNRKNHNTISIGIHNIPHDKMYNYCDPHIKREPDGTWWFSCLVKHEEPIETNESWLITEPIGIDLGIKTFVTTSSGDKFNYPKKKITKLKRQMKRKERRLTKMQKKMIDKSIRTKTKYEDIPKSKNMQKLEKKVFKSKRHIANIRRNVRYEIANTLIKRNPRAIVMEGLNVTGMVKNHPIATKLADLGFYEMKKVLKYKCKWNDIEFVEADRWFPSSKKCSCCGTIKKDLKLSDRVYKCPVCGLEMDRDLNAAINLKHLANIDILS